MDKNKVESIITEQGFNDFKWINPQEIIVAQWVRMKCTYGCKDYGKRSCPPNTPPVNECKDFINEYSDGIIIRVNKYIDKNSYPVEWAKDLTNKLLETERQLFLSGFHKTFLFNYDCCTLCKNCVSNNIDCKDKKNARPSPEAFAIDVFQTVRNAGMKINVIAENPSEINRYAIVLIN
ncbi:DUF2284 domain-containing protein [Bacteroidota bacterium]